MLFRPLSTWARAFSRSVMSAWAWARSCCSACVWAAELVGTGVPVPPAGAVPGALGAVGMEAGDVDGDDEVLDLVHPVARATAATAPASSTLQFAEAMPTGL